MPKPEYLVMGAGGLAFAGGFAESNGFPPNGYVVLSATAALTLIASATNNSPVQPVMTGLAGLMLLTAAIRYIPGLSTPQTGTSMKGKHHHGR